MKLDEFKKKFKPKKKSRLENFKDEIITLLRENYSHQSITIFLQKNGVVTTRRNVTKWINKTEIVEVKELHVAEKAKKKKEKATEVSSLLIKSNVQNNEIIEPDLSKYRY